MKWRSKTFFTFVILALLYVSINFLAAPPRATLERYSLTATQLRLLDTTFVLPIIVIWFIALYGYQKLRAYTSYIQRTKDGKQVLLLTRGIMYLSFWLPVGSTVSSALSLISRHTPSMHSTMIIVSNYLSLILPLIALSYISRGARGLSELSQQRPSQKGVNLMAIVLIIVGVLYGYLVTNAHGQIYSIYHMHLLLVLFTLVVPYIYSWYLGLLAAYEIRLYTKKVSGIIFRKGWAQLSFGIVWLILFSIVLQYVSSVSAKLNDLSLGWLLMLVYTILPLMAVGYIFVALGAKKLTKIEEV